MSLDAARSTHAVLTQRSATARREGASMLRAAQAKLQEADRVHCKAWNAIMFCGGPEVGSPTIRAAIRSGFPRLRVCCNGCAAERDVDLRTVHRPHSQVRLIENSLFCEACTKDRGRPPVPVVGQRVGKAASREGAMADLKTAWALARPSLTEDDVKHWHQLEDGVRERFGR